MEKDIYQTMLKTNQKIVDKEVELTEAKSELDDQLGKPFPAGQSANEVSFFMMKTERLAAKVKEREEQLEEFKRTRSNLNKMLMETQPMRTLLRRSGRFLADVVERSPALTLQKKPLYDPAGPEASLDLDLLVASAWHYFVLGRPLKAPGELDESMEDAVKARTQGSAGAVHPAIAFRQDVRHVGLVGASSGMGKTHLGLDVWYNRDKLDQPRFAQAAADAGVSEALWAHVCSVARGMRVCCANFNGGSAWGRVDRAIVELSPWYKTYLVSAMKVADDQEKQQQAETSASQADPLPSDKAESPLAIQADPLASDMAASPRVVQAGPLPSGQNKSPPAVRTALSPPARTVADAHLVPLYLRVLWGLMYQANVSYASFSQLALTELRLGHITAVGIIAEAEEALSACRHAIIVDELTLVSMQPGDRQLAELYRHVICTFTVKLQARVLFLSLSFMFIDAEVNKDRALLPSPHGGLPPQSDNLTTPGTGGEGSPWNLVVIGRLVRRSVADIKDKLLPVAARRVICTPRTVNGSNIAQAEDVADSLARLSGGHMRSYANLRNMLDSCPANILLWSVVEDAFQATGVTSSARKLLRHLIFFPGLLVAGLLPCTVEGKAMLHKAGDATPPAHYSVTFDDAISSNLLYGSPDKLGVYKDPSLPPAVILGLSKEWENVLAELKALGYKVSPVVCDILRACTRLLSAADQADPGHGWEVTSYWLEVMLSHVRHGAEKFLMGTAGVSGVEDFSRVSLKNLYKGVDNLLQPVTKPVRHQLLSDVMVDATWPLTPDDQVPELITRYYSVDDVLQLSTDERLKQPFMMVNSHPSFDMMRLLPVVYDPRPSAQSSSKTEGVVAVCVSSKLTTNMSKSVPVDVVGKSESKLRDAFGDNWNLWQDSVVHVTICNHKRTDKTQAFLDADVAKHTMVVCRNNFEGVYGLGLCGILSSAPMLHGTKVVR